MKLRLAKLHRQGNRSCRAAFGLRGEWAQQQHLRSRPYALISAFPPPPEVDNPNQLSVSRLLRSSGIRDTAFAVPQIAVPHMQYYRPSRKDCRVSALICDGGRPQQSQYSPFGTYSHFHRCIGSDPILVSRSTTWTQRVCRRPCKGR